MKTNRLSKLLALAMAAAASLLLSIATGSADIGVDTLWHLLWHPDDSVESRILHTLRLPRSLSAFTAGGLLGLAGTLMQVLLRNPMGDPYILGISGGAAVAVLCAMLLGIPYLWHTPVAFSGALFSMLLVMTLARRGEWNSTRLLLTGIVVAAGWSATISFLLSISPPMQLPGMLFWLMGDLSDALSPARPLTVLGLGALISLALAPALNIALRGGPQALALGVNIQRLHWWLYLLTSLLTATVVSMAGAIGFVGLIAPHMARLAVSSDHRLLIPAAILLGGGLLTLADTAARTLIAPMQLPVGVLTAMIGVPGFLLLLHNSGLRRP